ncbi:hypothetical protein EXU34_00415 [Alteromonas sp. ZYF713]|nr:hypothetical protein [Alteromonas sp. ZYF713]
MSTEQEIIKKHQPVIRALIPYQQQGRLLEGLNRFSSRLNAQARQIIKEEVIRLTSQTDAPADNSAFAQFPVKRFSHFGIEMTLDKVGTEILKKETARYMEQYTVGVFESITNSAHYQGLVQRKLREKIINAFTVQTQSYQDIQFNNDLSVTPNFSVATQAYQNGRTVAVVGLSATQLTIACTRSPKFTSVTDIPVSFPHIAGLCSATEVIHFNYVRVEFNAASQRHHAVLQLAEQDQHWQTVFQQYLNRVMLRLPLERDLEIERSMQALDRDRIVQNSPWLPVLMKQDGARLTPRMVLLTPVNTQRNPAYRSKQLLPGKTALQRILKELSAFNEAFVLRLTITKRGSHPVSLCTTVRQLERQNLLANFVQLGLEHESLELWQYRLAKVSRNSQETARILQDMSHQDHNDILSMGHILYIRSINEALGPLQLLSQPDKAKLPRQYIDHDSQYPLHFVMNEDIDRRKQPRFRIETDAQVKVSLMSSYAATVRDFSLGGIQLQIHDCQEAVLPPEVKVSIVDFKLKSQRYKVLDYNQQTGVLRLLAIATDTTSKVLKKLSSGSSLQSSIENIMLRQSLYFRYMWEVVSRHYPNAALQVVTGRQMIHRMKTLYTTQQNNDLHPFAVCDHNAPLHGFFADMGKSPPDSSVLRRLLQQAERYHLAIHCERKADNKLINLTQVQCFESSLRYKIKQSLEEEETQLYAAGIECQKNESVSTPMSKQRLALLSRIDLDVYEKLQALQQNYSHVIHIIDLSALLNSFIKAGVVPAPAKENAAAAASANKVT